MAPADVFLQLRLAFAFGALEQLVCSTLIKAAHMGAHVSNKRPAVKGLSSTDSRARPNSPSRVPPGGMLAAASQAKTVAARSLAHLREGSGSPDDEDAHRTPRSRGIAHLPVVGFMTRDQLWEELAVRSWSEFSAALWPRRRELAARLVALETIEAVEDPRNTSSPDLGPNVIAAKVELAGALFMLGAHDLATEAAIALLAAAKESDSISGGSGESGGLPGLLRARLHLLRAVCMSIEAAVDPAALQKQLAAARNAVERDEHTGESDRARVAEAARLLDVVGNPNRLSTESSDSRCFVACAADALRGAGLIIGAERELNGAPAAAMYTKVAARLQKAANAREREAVEQELEVDAALLRQRAQALTLRVNEEARRIEKHVQNAVAAYADAVADAGAEAVASCLRVTAQLLLIAGRCQWAAGRHREAQRWLVMAAAAFEHPSRMHLFARWCVTLVDAKAPVAAFDATLDPATAEVDLEWIGDDHDEPDARSRKKGKRQRRARRAADDGSSSSSSSSDGDHADTADASHPSQHQKLTPYDEMLRVWPHGDATLQPYLKHALAAATHTPEAMRDVALSAQYAASAVRVVGREADEACRALQAFEAKQGRVKAPRASPSWGVVELLQPIKLSTPGGSGITRILYSLTGYPGKSSDVPGTLEYTAPIVLTETGRVTLRMVAENADRRRSGVVELHYFVVLPSK
jgi:hypothetical protein